MQKTEYTRPVTIAYVGGGSLNWATKLMGDLAQDGTVPATVRLYDLDHASAQRNARIGARYAARNATGAPVTYTAEKTLDAALTGADIVIISILPGSFEDMANDIAIPERYGIRQSVGDTVGPGGFVRAMRAIPMIAEIGRAIARHCPEAYVCNLTNPMSVLTGTLYAVFPEIRAWGSCHEVIKTRKIMAYLANRQAGEVLYGYRDAKVNVLGINHFTFVDRATVAGLDMMPAYLAFARAQHATGWRESPLDPANEHDRYFTDSFRVKFDLSLRFGIAAAAGDRHLVEFLPQSWYLDDHAAWKFGLTPVEFRMRERKEKVDYADALDQGAELPPARASDEAIVEQIKALLGGPEHVSNVNLPNHGQLAGFSTGTIVETNARFSALGIQPVVAGRLPRAVELITRPHADRQDALVAAILSDDVDALLPLFVSDPLVAALPQEKAARLFRDMVSATRHRLPETLIRAGDAA
ncbi:alpha-galactosidase [Peteryoungia aggregata LMG 23059]|uniref:Alpha-galactosidase n=1 Tax=Peteryoungia aggregata LMG 23059 TaxID=1368425 RepID=A0ABU0G1X6_9HYPH|nr:alpha-galactosidase [Peteryoungia aggregata]MDQ0419321.1 alpha-galactosidase [Peteryoungia aggregata LMG 23059]